MGCRLQVQKWQGQEVQRWETDAGQLGATFLSRCGIDVGKVDLVVSVRPARCVSLCVRSLRALTRPSMPFARTVHLHCMCTEWTTLPDLPPAVCTYA